MIEKEAKMSLMIIDSLHKSYGEKKLFDGISFTIEPQDKIGLIGVNGTGKTTLLNVLSGKDSADLGDISFSKNLTVSYLSQQPEFLTHETVLEYVLKGETTQMQTIRAYEACLEATQADPQDQKLQDQLLALTHEMTRLDLWTFESTIKTILTQLDIHDLHQSVDTLSGGQKKRVALSQVLISPCDLLILDEPTNHMDSDTIDWLEDYLASRKGALLMITHDRYFLDRVTNRIIELSFGQLYSYVGNYTDYLEQKTERQEATAVANKKTKNLYQSELAWIRAGVQGRGTKQKARKQRFEEIKSALQTDQDNTLDISIPHTRLGKKIIEMDHLSFAYDKDYLIQDFTYTATKEDRIGIIGDNGMGKTTLLKLITGTLKPSKGNIDLGPTVQIGYYSQDADELDLDETAIQSVKSIAELVTTQDGSQITASQMMERFLFPSDLQWTKVGRLSGGERRRLNLLRTLMLAPNVLILDEPTNDLDLETLQVLEHYLDHFQGLVLIVSHDRYFLDRTCQQIFAFEGQGLIYKYTGNYSDYHQNRKENLMEAQAQTPKPQEKNLRDKPKKLKLTYKEQQVYDTIEDDMALLSDQIDKIDVAMQACATDFVKLQALQDQKDALEEELLEKMATHETLQALVDQIDAQ